MPDEAQTPELIAEENAALIRDTIRRFVDEVEAIVDRLMPELEIATAAFIARIRANKELREVIIIDGSSDMKMRDMVGHFHRIPDVKPEPLPLREPENWQDRNKAQQRRALKGGR
jgi:hypothetical protein